MSSLVLLERPQESSLSGSCAVLLKTCLLVPPTGFVKSQEGENEEGSEGELVVKFGETLPKVTQEQRRFCIHRPEVLASGRAPAGQKQLPLFHGGL